MATKAIIFDYGNTLAQCAAPQLSYQDEQLGVLLAEMLSQFDETDFRAQRDRDRRAPYFNGYVENNIHDISHDLVQSLFGRPPDAGQMQRIIDLRFTSFLDSIQVADKCDEVLTTLSGRHRLALLSNYPCGKTIRASLDRNGITPHFDAIVVSGDLGYVKPHPAPFEKVLGELDIDAGDAVYVGDNWLADIQGAKSIGMGAVHTRQWDTPEKFDPQENDHAPDHTIDDLRELLALGF